MAFSKAKKQGFALLALLIAALSIASIVRTFSYNTSTCSVKINGVLQDCPRAFANYCEATETAAFQSVSNANSPTISRVITVECPWKPASVGVSVAFCAITVFTILIALLSLKIEKALGSYYVLTGLAVIGLIVAVVLMILDVIKGVKAGVDFAKNGLRFFSSYYNATSVSTQSQFGGFVSVVIMQIVLIVLLLGAAIWAFKSNRFQKKAPVVSNQPLPNTSQSQCYPNQSYTNQGYPTQTYPNQSYTNQNASHIEMSTDRAYRKPF